MMRGGGHRRPGAGTRRTWAPARLSRTSRSGRGLGVALAVWVALGASGAARAEEAAPDGHPPVTEGTPLTGAQGPAAGIPAGTGTLWAGHQVVLGQEKVPVLGALDIRIDTYLLARREDRDGHVVLRQHACRTDFAPVAGVTTQVPNRFIRTLPPDVIRFFPKDDWWYAAPWVSGWDAVDRDRDGDPGITVEVDAPLCGGQVYVASESENQARAKLGEGRITGEIRVKSHQDILGASNVCLRIFSSDKMQKLEGAFTYVPVPEGVTCDGLLEDGWPVEAGAGEERAGDGALPKAGKTPP